MIRKQRRTEESADMPSMEHGGGAGMGTLLFATALGVGVGLLTAPDTGRHTRKQLRKRVAGLSGEALDRWGDVQDRLEGVRDVGAKTGKRMRKRLAHLREDAEGARQALADRWEHRYEDADEEDEERGGGIVGTALWIAAGAALAYLLTADGAAPARAKVQSAATDLRRQAADRWDRFQRGDTGAEFGAGEEGRGMPRPSSGETPQAS